MPLTFTANAAKAPGDTTWANDDAAGSCGGSMGGDVVYSFTLAADSSATVKVVADPSTPKYEPIFYLRSGATSCGSAAIADERGCSQAVSGIAQRTYPLLTAGTYYLWVDSPVSGGGAFAVFVNTAAPTTPLNDYCSQAAPLDFSTATQVKVHGSTAAATGDTIASCSSFPGDNNPDLVWTFTTTVAKRFTASVTGLNSFEPALYLRTSCGSPATDVACAESDSWYGVTADLGIASLPPGTYYLWVDGSTTYLNPPVAGDFDLTVNLDPTDPSAAGDTCFTPQPLAFSSGVATVQGKTGFAFDSGSGSCQGKTDTSPDVVYSLSLATASSVNLEVTTATATYRPAVYLRRACASALPSDEVACLVAPAAGSPASLLLTDVPAGNYYLWIDGLSSSGDYTLTVKLGPVIAPPANDVCSGAEKLTLNTVTPGHTIYAKDDFGQGTFSAICSGGSALKLPGPDVVYLYTPAASGSFTVTVTPDFDAVLWSTAGATCAGTGIACTDLSNAGGVGGVESLTVAGVAGTNYYFVVDSAAAPTSGQFTLVVK